MRHLLSLLLLILSCSGPALANDPPPAPDRPSPQRTRMTTEQRFQAANTTQDGRLTREQARLSYRVIARHFDVIDTTGKGFVTLDEILAWQKSQRDAREAARAAMNDPLRPRQAMQRVPAGQEQPMAEPTRVIQPQSEVDPAPNAPDTEASK